MRRIGASVQFRYGYNGMRTQKVVNSTTTDYTYHGTLLTNLKQGSNYMHFYYDAQGRPAMVDFNGTKYMYLHNLQGDIVGLLDSSGNLVVQYRYDAWGKLLATSTLTTAYTTLANLNPLRYRGYVYDTETGLYYLRSRYYNPVWSRFISADSLLGKAGGVLSHNGFTYCRNDPVPFFDPSGKFVSWLIPIIVVLFLTGCAKKNTLRESPNLNRDTDQSLEYNCYGNSIGKRVRTNPSGYVVGMSTRETFGLVKKDVGEENITIRDTLFDEIPDDEYMVAVKCGSDDYHFIVYDNGEIYNKQGITDLVVGCTEECIMADIWYPHFHTEEQLIKYCDILGGDLIAYDDETIYFSIKRNWSN